MNLAVKLITRLVTPTIKAVTRRLVSPSIVIVGKRTSSNIKVAAFTSIDPRPKVKSRIGPKARRIRGLINRLIKERAAAVRAKPSIVWEIIISGSMVPARYSAMPFERNINEKLRIIPMQSF